MLLNVVVQVGEGLNLLQVLYGNGDFVVELHQCDEVNQVNTVEIQRFLQVRIGANSLSSISNSSASRLFTCVMISSLVMTLFLIFNLKV